MSLAELHMGPLRTARRRATDPRLWVFLGLTAALSGGLVVAVAEGMADWGGPSGLALGLAAISALWISGGAVTAVLGLMQPEDPRAEVPEAWRPRGATAILVTLCGEPAAPVARRLADLRRSLDRLGLSAEARIFVLSDTAGDDRIAAEEEALAPLAEAGVLSYRRRAVNTGRKPGNIADWLAAEGEAHAYMLVLDADSRMTADRVRRLIHRIDTRPRTGLVQAGMTLVPGQSVFGRHQRLSSRLLSPNFGRGLAAWSGEAGNYWGHNAIMRVAAFRAAADLPVLSGRAPFGGAPLSHDFVEAAWIRRAGWAVELDADATGSAEDGPQTLAEFHRRDRRWCQGNLQHIRLLGAPGLDPVSRLHLASGIIGYLAAPIWLVLVTLTASGAVTVSGVLPVILIALVLLLPKLCALAVWLPRARTEARRQVILRASLAELALSTVVAPLIMVRQTGAVASVLMGRDCGWKSGTAPRIGLPRGVPELGVGLSLFALAALSGPAPAIWWLVPVALPLSCAPLILPALDAAA